LCKRLQKKCKVTLVEPRDHFYYVIGYPRVLVDEKFADSCLVPYTAIFKSGRDSTTLVHRRAEHISAADNAVKLDDGSVLKYDFLVIAIGSENRAAHKTATITSKEQVLEAIRGRNRQVRDAKKLVVVGGGAVGLESAGEIASAYPNTSVILVHQGKQLMEYKGSHFYPDKFHAKLLAKIAEMPNVTLKLGESIEVASGGASASTTSNDDDADAKSTSVRLKSGETISDVDVVLWTVGAQSLVESPLVSAFAHTADGLTVNANLQLTAHANIFAAGDIAATGDRKMWISAKGHVGTVASNIEKLAVSAKSTLVPYKAASTKMIVLPLGPARGISIMPGGFVLGSKVTSGLKGKDYFVSRTFKDMGV